MVFILPNNQRPRFAERLNQGIQQSIPVAQNFLDRYEQKQKLGKENEALKNRFNVDLTDIQDPNLRHALASKAIQRKENQRQAESTRNVTSDPNAYLNDEIQDNTPRNLVSEGNAPRKMGENAPSEKQVSQERENQRTMPKIKEGATKKTNIQTLNDKFSKLFQPETKGQKVNILTPDQIISAGAKYAAQYNQMNPENPISNEQGEQFIENKNVRAENYNAKIDAEKRASTALEREYGSLAQQEFSKVFDPEMDSSAVMDAWFNKRGEEIASEGGTEAQIKQKLAKEADELKSQLANIRRTPYQSAVSELGRKQEGTSKEIEEVKQDFQRRAKPFLDKGWYDLLRYELKERNLDPETIEDWITTLPESATKIVNEMPLMKHESIPLNLTPFSSGYAEDRMLTPESSDVFEENLKKTLKENPNANLILLRKMYNDKSKVGWKSFNQALNSLIATGDFKLSEDQIKQEEILSNPPLRGLNWLWSQVSLPRKKK